MRSWCAYEVRTVKKFGLDPRGHVRIMTFTSRGPKHVFHTSQSTTEILLSQWVDFSYEQELS